MRVQPFSYLEQRDTGPSGPAQVNQTGLLAWYDANFPGSSPSTTWEDLTGNATNNLTLVNTPTYTGTTNASYYEIASANNNHFLRQGWYWAEDKPDLTIQVLIYPTIDYRTSGRGRIFGVSDASNAPTRRSFFGCFDGSMSFSIGEFSSTQNRIDTSNSTYLFAPNAWQNYTVTVDASYDMVGYQETTVWGTGTWSSTLGFPGPNYNGFYWGQQFQGSENFDGRFAVMLVYDRALTSQEIQDNITAINTRYSY